MSERDKMLRGELYLATDPELTRARARARDLWQRLNAPAADRSDERRRLLEELVGSIAPDAVIEPPFYCDYGTQIHLAAGVFVNFNCVVLDPAPIHTTRVWIGGGSIVCPGVTIGDDSTIGAGSVVVRDIPAGVVAAGNPCRVLRSL